MVRIGCIILRVLSLSYVRVQPCTNKTLLVRACARLKQPNSSMPDPTAICSSVTKTFIPHVRAWKQTRTDIQIFYCADTNDLAIRTDFGRNSLLPISTAYLNFTGLVILFYWSSHPYFFGHPIGYSSEIGSRTTKFLTYVFVTTLR